MGRYRSTGSRGHRISRVSADHYWLSWVVDRYYPGLRLRHPRSCKRSTDESGALRFAKRWSLPDPRPSSPEQKERQ